MTEAASAGLTAVVDGGTSRTRLRLWDGKRIVWDGSRQIGAGNVATGGRARLETAVLELLSESRSHGWAERIVAHGMITSNMGLCEIPHIEAPVTYDGLARAIAVRHLAKLGTIHFIPGIKTVGASRHPEDIASFDIMRGEETEVAGMRDLLSLSGPVNFLHVGSHHKLVRTDDHAILGSTTGLSGELLAALLHHTILASSAALLESLEKVDQSWWAAGLHTATAHGFARAAFCVRLADQILHARPEQASAFLLGAVASLDLRILMTDLPLVLYGHLIVTSPLAIHLRDAGVKAEIVQPETSTLAGVRAAVRLLDRQRDLAGRSGSWLHGGNDEAASASEGK